MSNQGGQRTGGGRPQGGGQNQGKQQRNERQEKPDNNNGNNNRNPRPQNNQGPKPQNNQGPKPQQANPDQNPKPQQQQRQANPDQPKAAQSPALAPQQFAHVSLPNNIQLLPPLTPGTTNIAPKKFTVTTNNFALSLDSTLLSAVYQYSVAFEPEVPSSHVKRKLFYNAALMSKTPLLEWLAFDGQAMAYSFLPIENMTFDTCQLQTDLVNQKLLYDEFGNLMDQTPKQDQSHKITITCTNKCNLGPALDNIKSNNASIQALASSLGEIAPNHLISTDIVRARSDLASFVNLSLSTLVRHLSVVFACHSERNRIRLLINKTADAAYWKKNANIRIMLSIEGFISRNGSLYRLDRPDVYSEANYLGGAVYAVPAAFSALRFLKAGVTFNVAQTCIPSFRLGQPLVKVLEQIAPHGDLSKASESVYRQVLKYRAITSHLPPGKNTRVPLHQVGKRLKDCAPFVDDATGKKISIQDYFKQKYKINLNPNYYTYQIEKVTPARTDPKTGRVTPSRTMTLIYPVEVLTLYSANNNGVKDLDAFQTKAMLNLMTRRPHQSLTAAAAQLKELETALRYMVQQTPGSAETLFEKGKTPANYVGKSIYDGIKINQSPMQAEGRVLPAPSAEFGNNQVVAAAAGEFRVPSFKLVEPASDQPIGPIRAVVANFSQKLSRDQQMVVTYAEELIKCAGQKGLKITRDTTEPVFTQTFFNGRAAQDVEQWVRQLYQKGKNTKSTYLVIAVMDSNSEFYHCLKRCGDSQIGLVTQCADSSKVLKTFGSQRGPPNQSAIASYVGNIVLKLNGKLGGLNYRLRSAKPEHNPILTKKYPTPHPTLSTEAPLAVFGIDIFHNPGSRSHAGVVGTYDRSCSKYNGYLIQQPKSKQGKAQTSQEVIDPSTIQRAFTSLFLQFSKKQSTPSLPQQIVVYRDGLSESQIPLCMDFEIPGIVAAAQQAYLTLFPTSTYQYKPTITYLIAVKRHQIFFQPNTGEDDPMGKDKRTENVRAGTVVDTAIVRHDVTEFYLQAHASALGTGKCTLYQVVYCSDPSAAKLDDLELLTNYLSYGIQRATKATRIPSPVSHADLVCYRGRSFAAPNSPDGSWAVDEMPVDLIGRQYWL